MNHVFLDLDDVLNNFTSDLGKLFGVGEGSGDLSWFPGECGYDIVSALRRLGWSKDILSPYLFWSTLPETCWSQASKSAICDKLVRRLLASYSARNITILTSVARGQSTASVAAKIEWIKNNLPVELHNRYIIIATGEKWRLAGSGCLLIDDNVDNCRMFTEACGDAMIVDRPWNQSCRGEFGRIRKMLNAIPNHTS